MIFCSFGDMLRVPGSREDLFSVRARGGDVRIVYSPLDATRVAADNPDKEVVFFGVGFETTAPANAMAVVHAHRLGLTNFSMLVSHVLVPPAMTAILSSPANRVEGFLAAGHVCTVMGTANTARWSTEFKVPIVVTGSSRSICSKASVRLSTCWRRASPSCATPIRGPSPTPATLSRNRPWPRYSWSPTGRGAVSA